MEAAVGVDQMMNPALYRAAVEGKPADYQAALRQTAEGVGRQVTPNGNTVLHLAALHGQKHFVEKILNEEEDHVASSMLLARNKNNETVLHCAAEKGYANIVSVLISATTTYENLELGVGVKEMIRMTDDAKDTALHKAVRKGHLDVVKLLVEEDTEFEYPANDAGETPIYIAAELQFDHCLVEILNTCKKLTCDGPLGRNALHAAILSGSERTISRWEASKTLLAWYIAEDPVHRIEHISKCTKPLLERVISLCEKADDFGWTPLHYAVRIHNVEAARMILEEKISVAYIRAGKGKEWTTIFHIAAREGNVKIMKYISNSCPDCWEMVNSKGQNVFHEAVLSNRVNVIKHIVSSNQLDNLVEHKDEDGNTPLHLLVTSDSGTVERIMKQHPTWNYLVFNKHHRTLFDMADVEHIKRSTSIRAFWSGKKIARRVGLTETSKRKNTDEEEEEIKVMQQTSQTSIVAATLILTMTFAAGFAMPGGYDSNPDSTQGRPVLLHNAVFKTFVITDTIAFMCSILSIILHNAMMKEASSSRRYSIVLKLYIFEGRMLSYATGGVVAAFLFGMYATVAPLRGLAVGVSVVALAITVPTSIIIIKFF